MGLLRDLASDLWHRARARATPEQHAPRPEHFSRPPASRSRPAAAPLPYGAHSSPGRLARYKAAGMPMYTVDADLCDGCGACVAVCPTEAAQLGEQVASIEQLCCTFCDACVAVCPHDAIKES